MTANLDVHEPETPKDRDSPLGYQMEGDPRQPPASLIPYFWAPRWNSIQSVNKYQASIAGDLQTGSAGVRLIEPATEARRDPPMTAPPAFAARAGQWLGLPMFRIFGSDETSARAQGLASLVEKPCLGIREEDARSLGIAEGDVVTVAAGAFTAKLPVRLQSDLPPGTVGITAGYADTAWAELPAWVRVSVAS